MCSIDSWHNLSEPMRIAVVSTAAALIGIVLTALISLIVMWVQARMSRKAIESQERMMFLNLIERRSAWLDSAQHFWSSWIKEQEEFIEAALLGRLSDTESAMRSIAQNRREARWLFGPEVIHHLDKLEAAVRRYGDRRLRLREISQMSEAQRPHVDMPQRSADFSKAVGEMNSLQSKLGNVLAPYLYVGDIRYPEQQTESRASKFWSWVRTRFNAMKRSA